MPNAKKYSFITSARPAWHRKMKTNTCMNFLRDSCGTMRKKFDSRIHVEMAKPAAMNAHCTAGLGMTQSIYEDQRKRVCLPNKCRQNAGLV